MTPRLVAATLLFSICGVAPAQSIHWSHRILGVVDPDSATGESYSYYPTVSLDRSRPMMAWSASGTPGLVTIGNQSENNRDTLAVKLAGADGTELWRTALSTPPFSGTYSVAVDGAGDIVTAGGVLGPMWMEVANLRKISGATGQVIFDHTSALPDSLGSALVAVATDGDGDIVAVGSRIDETNPQFYLLKFSGTTGLPLWLTSIPNVTAGNDARIAVDAGGNLVATPSRTHVTRTAPDGQPLWIVDLSQHPGSDACAIRALAIDPVTSDAIVAGRSNCANPQARGFVARVRASDGAVVWMTAGIGNAPQTDVRALALDGAGRLVVAGGSTYEAQSQWFAARLSLADGSVAWSVPVGESTRYAATDLAFGANGDVLLTGVCAGNAHCAASLDAAAGTQRWILQTGTPYAQGPENYPNAITAAAGAVYFGGKDTSEGKTTWTVHRINDDALFGDAFE